MNRRAIKLRAHVARRQLYQEKRTKKKDYTGQSFGPVYSGNTFVNLFAPPIFKLQHENCVDVLKYINLIKKTAEKRKNIIINFDKVIDIREGAIAMLLSVMKEVEKIGISIKGTEPRNLGAKLILENSGFFKFVNRRVKTQSTTTKNLMRTGKRGTSPDFLGPEVRKAMETVWGSLGRNPYVRTTVFEMMRNSCDHAFQEGENIWWHLSISHDEENNLVKFSFVDNGKGIIRTLRGSLLSQVIRHFKDSADILDTAFNKGIESRTGLSWRGLGLPTIFESYADGYIKNFLVISNDAFIHYDKNIKVELPISYGGTYYYWEVDRSCIEVCLE